MAHEGSTNFIRPPKCLEIDNTNQMGIKWKNWIQQYKWFEVATQMDKKTEQIQIATFMASLGPDALDVYNSFNLKNEDTEKLEKIKSKFEEHFAPKSSITLERYVFNKMYQMESENFDQYYTKIKNQCKKCEFGELSDSLLRDKIIIGIRSEVVREKLLSETEPTLEIAIKKCKTSEMTAMQLTELQRKQSQTVDAIALRKSVKNKKPEDTVKSDETFDCKRCGTKHSKRNCPAFGRKCNKCKYRGHFAKMCTVNRVAEIEMERNNSEFSDLVIDSINTVDDDKNWVEEIRINQVKIKAKLDTGAQCNVLPKHIVDKLGIRIVKSNTRRIIGFGNNNVDVVGEVEVDCQVRNKMTKLIFKVVKANVTPILGKEACEREKLIIRVEELRINNNIFDGLGCVKNYEYDIDLVEHPKFEIKPVRKVPLAIKDQVKAEIENMVKMGVLAKVHEVTPVVSPMVVVRKEGRLRVCLDPTDVNNNIVRRYHPLKTIEEMVTRMKKAKLFTILDCKKGFWQIKVSSRTEKYLTMGTPWGRYSYKRLPFGLSSAPEVFQDLMNQILGDLENVECYMDDILIHAENSKQLEIITNQVLKKVEEAGLKLNKDKCIFGASEVKFLGHVLSGSGLSSDPDKTAAIKNLKRPTNVKELQRLLGMATYLSKFVPNLSAITKPLRNLIINKVEWNWTKEQEKAFDELKLAFSSTPILKFYNTNEDVTIQVDASMNGFGAALLQNGQPVAYASKALSQAQRNYPPIELEAAAIRWACGKFHEYVYGKKLRIESDHKPLECIYKKQLRSAPFRLQRIMFDIKQYSPTVVYVKGTSQHIADILSRDCVNNESEEEEELQVYVAIDFSKDAKREMVEATKHDQEIQELIKVTMSGWPNNQAEIHEWVKPYWNFREEISYYNGLVFKGMKLVVPKAQIPKMLYNIHRGHFGIQKCLSRAREILYWRGMSTDITSYVETCSICQSMQRSKVKEPVINKEIPSLPFEVVGADLFHCIDKDYILVVDSYSGYFEFKELKMSTAKEVIEILKICFSTHGIPAKLETDNGPQFSAAEFKKFVSDWSINHATSSPNHPQGNGLIERYVQIAKGMIKKCKKDNSCIYLALLNYRNTPTSSSLASPNQRLMSRATRTTIVGLPEMLKPKIISDITHKLTEIRKIQKWYADRGRRIAEPLNAGDKVRIKRSDRDWVPGVITEKTNNPRSFIVRTENGNIYRRNTDHINKTREQTTSNESFNNVNRIVQTTSNVSFNNVNRITEPIHIPESINDTNHTKVSKESNESTSGNCASDDNGEVVHNNNTKETSHMEATTKLPIVTRSGRVVKPINKMDL